MKFTESVILKALGEQYREPEAVVLSQVRSSTGFEERSPRTADALICFTWPSRSFETWGVEVKVSKSDLKAEVENPEKAERIAQYCDRWMIACPAGMISPKDLPKGWGLMTVSEDLKVKVVKSGDLLEAKPWPRGLVMSMLRSATKQRPTLGEEAIASIRRAAHAAGVREGQKASTAQKSDVRFYQSRAEAAEKRLREVLDLVGIDDRNLYTPISHYRNLITLCEKGILTDRVAHLTSILQPIIRMVDDLKALEPLLKETDRENRRLLKPTNTDTY